jgi:hypothetical protein
MAQRQVAALRVLGKWDTQGEASAQEAIDQAGMRQGPEAAVEDASRHHSEGDEVRDVFARGGDAEEADQAWLEGTGDGQRREEVMGDCWNVGGASPRTQVGHLVEEKMMSGEEAEEKSVSQFRGKIEEPVQRAMAESG